MHQPSDNNRIVTRKLPVPVKGTSAREVTREEIEEAAKYYTAPVVPDDCYTVEDGDWFDPKSYITAAFRCSFGKQAYIFMDNEYLLLDYDLKTLDGVVLDGPKIIRNGIPCLVDTDFGDDGIYCAFGLHHCNQAFIFSQYTCARISYALDSSDFKILEGPMIVNRMFPCLIGTSFEFCVDAAFESSTDNEAYLFSGNEYAVINYQDRRLISDRQTFNCLKGTVFQSGIDAAFASHVAGEAFVFKDDSYALINYAADKIVGSVKKILPDDCPCLSCVFPRKNNCTECDLDDFLIFAIDEEEEEEEEEEEYEYMYEDEEYEYMYEDEDKDLY